MGYPLGLWQVIWKIEFLYVSLNVFSNLKPMFSKFSWTLFCVKLCNTRHYECTFLQLRRVINILRYQELTYKFIEKEMSRFRLFVEICNHVPVWYCSVICPCIYFNEISSYIWNVEYLKVFFLPFANIYWNLEIMEEVDVLTCMKFCLTNLISKE